MDLKQADLLIKPARKRSSVEKKLSNGRDASYTCTLSPGHSVLSLFCTRFTVPGLYSGVKQITSGP